MDRRTFLTTAIAGAAAASAPRAFADVQLEAGATRIAADRLALTWTPAARPASIYVSTDPDAPRAFMRPLLSKVMSGKAQLPLAATPRPYLMITTPGGGQVRVAERLLPLKGGRNFRDLGGYRAADGRQVRWGHIYRSGVMSGLTPEDLTYLSGLGIGVICDLRSAQERRGEPSPFLKVETTEVVAFDYDLSSSLAKLGQARTRAEAVRVFADAYIDFLDMLTPQYTDMFARLVRRQTPLAMNCSAGKDRTGMGSALILSVLGVPRETVIADYALSQTFTPPAMYTRQVKAGAPVSGVSPGQAQAFGQMPPEVLNVIMGSDPDVMRLALATVDQKFGGPVELAKSRFGLTEGKITSLKAGYLI